MTPWLVATMVVLPSPVVVTNPVGDTSAAPGFELEKLTGAETGLPWASCSRTVS